MLLLMCYMKIPFFWGGGETDTTHAVGVARTKLFCNLCQNSFLSFSTLYTRKDANYF